MAKSRGGAFLGSPGARNDKLINELSVSKNETVSSLKSIVDSVGIVNVQCLSLGCYERLELSIFLHILLFAL